MVDEAVRIEAEDILRTLSDHDKADDAFFELAKRAFGDEVADEVMYQRFLARGRRKAEEQH